MSDGVEVVLHAFEHRFKVAELNRVALEHVLKGDEDRMLVFVKVAVVGGSELASDVHERHESALVFLFGQRRRGMLMHLVNDRMARFCGGQQFRRGVHVRFFVPIHDVVHPAAQGVHGVNGFSLLHLEGRKRRVEGGRGLSAHRFAIGVSVGQ